ncbi:MAG: biotin--[acetyl-CoA-carboxylase] ligase [Bacteroidia bacterium]|nr:biotin--[acetyl-CoA-carboxylase] ligase [Bacteroidia bacterium]
MGRLKRYFFPEIDSTQSLLRSWTEEGYCSSDILVWTHHQRAGYGRKGTPWLSTPGESLTFSFLLHEVISPRTLSARVALALYDVVSLYAEHPIALKWPNDLWAAPRPLGKLAGILTELRWAGEKPLYAIVGVGLNVYQRSFPPELCALSLTQIGKPPPSLERLMDEFEIYFERWGNATEAQVRQAFIQRAWRTGTLNMSEERLPARLVGWNEADELLFETSRDIYRLPVSEADIRWQVRFSV